MCNYFIILFFQLVDDLRRQVWPLLLGVDREQCDRVPTLEELSTHPEYNQVVLDVNRSLKRFPPGIPIQQRLAVSQMIVSQFSAHLQFSFFFKLQDQLTVIILRVITKHPHLSYYQVRFYSIFEKKII